jgi:imidazolonepropionase-like amidohydrolase
LTGHAVVIKGERIKKVAPVEGISISADDRIYDFPNATLLPGLINNHVHLVLPGDNTPFTPWIDTQSDAALALRAAHNAQASLRAGVTTVRDCGGRRNVTLDVRNAQAEGLIQGARIIACGWPLTITGGHTRHFGGEVDGETGIVQMVRRVVGNGADFVKVMASGGGTPGTFPQYPSFTVAELRTMVETAHAFERKVAAHCTTAPAILNAIEAGVDLIEHAMFMTPALTSQVERPVLERLAASGIPVTPTLQVNRDMIEQLPAGPERELWRQRNQVQREGVAAMHELGVPLLAGSDAGWRATAFDTFWKELDELAACGLSPTAVVHAATGAVTAALGYGDQWGTIQPGQMADMAIFAGDVAADVQRLRHVQAIFQAGELMHADEQHL